MEFDIHTLAIVLSFLITAQAIALYVNYNINKTHRCLLYWAIGSIILSLGFGFNFLRDAPEIGQFSVLANNMLFIFGLYVIYLGILRFLNTHEKPTWFVFSYILFSLIIFFFTYIENMLSVRTVIISLAVSGISFRMVQQLLSYRNRSNLFANNFLALVFLILGVLFLIRSIITFFVPLDHMFSGSVLQTATYFIVIIASTLWTLGFIILVNQKLNRQIHEDKENMDLIFNTSPDSVIITRMQDGCIVLTNSGFSTLTGFSKEDAIGKSTTELGIWKNPEDRLQLTQPLIDKGFCENIEVVFQRKNKTFFTGLLSAKIIKLHNVEHIITVTRDISKLRLTEKELHESTWRLENIIEGTQAGTWEWNVQTGKTIFNNYWAEMIGYTLKELEPVDIKTWKELTHPEDLLKSNELLKKHFTGELPYYDFELRMKHKNGSWVWIHDRGRVVTHTEDGQPLLMFGMHTLITERKEIEEKIKFHNNELKKMNIEKDKFFSIIAHDLKSPFNSIIGFSELLVAEAKNKDFESIEQYAGVILKSSNHAMDLLLNLMEWSRSQTGRMEFNPVQFEMAELIQNVVHTFSEMLTQKSIEINLELPPVALVFADKNMIGTVIRNLISNAIKFTESKGKITVTAKNTGNQLIVSVIDNGVGIPEENIKKLFRIDCEFSTRGTQNEKGTGLGLILCKEFTEKNKGEIGVASKPGKGSVFYFTLPGFANSNP